MIVDIYEIDSSDGPGPGGTVTGATRLLLKQCMNRGFSTVGASVQAAIEGGAGTPSEQVRVPLKLSSGVSAALAELVALGNHGQIFAVFCTPTEVAAMVTSGNVPNS